MRSLVRLRWNTRYNPVIIVLVIVATTYVILEYDTRYDLITNLVINVFLKKK